MKRIYQYEIKAIRVCEGTAELHDDITCPTAAIEYLRNAGMEDYLQEHFVVLLLNAKKKIIGYHTVSIGSASSCIAAPSDVYRVPILQGATSIIVAHNHPSGDTNPSCEDIAISKRIRECGELLGIPCVDSIIIGKDGRSYSFLESGRYI